MTRTHPALRGAALALQDLARDLSAAAIDFADNTREPFSRDDLKDISDALEAWSEALTHYNEVAEQHTKKPSA